MMQNMDSILTRQCSWHLLGQKIHLNVPVDILEAFLVISIYLQVEVGLEAQLEWLEEEQAALDASHLIACAAS